MTNETLQIDTPENVAFGYQVAGLGSRFMAALVDTLIIIVLQGLFYLFLILVVFQFESLKWTSWLVAVYSLIAFLFLWGYYVFYEMRWNGQSPGKRWVGLRVIRTDGMTISLTESLIRNLVRIVDFLPVGYGVGSVAMFISSQSRRLGDLAAGTLVVYDRGSLTLPALPDVPPFAPGDRQIKSAALSDLPVNRLSNQDILLVQEFFSRDLALVEREKLAVQILTLLYRHMGITDRPIELKTAQVSLAEILDAVSARNAGQDE